MKYLKLLCHAQDGEGHVDDDCWQTTVYDIVLDWFVMVIYEDLDQSQCINVIDSECRAGAWYYDGD